MLSGWRHKVPYSTPIKKLLVKWPDALKKKKTHNTKKRKGKNINLKHVGPYLTATPQRRSPRALHNKLSFELFYFSVFFSVFNF